MTNKAALLTWEERNPSVYKRDLSRVIKSLKKFLCQQRGQPMTSLEEQIRETIDRYSAQYDGQDEYHYEALSGDEKAGLTTELAALVRERERAAYYKGFFDKMFDNNMLADENPNKEQPK